METLEGGNFKLSGICGWGMWDSLECIVLDLY